MFSTSKTYSYQQLVKAMGKTMEKMCKPAVNDMLYHFNDIVTKLGTGNNSKKNKSIKN